MNPKTYRRMVDSLGGVAQVAKLLGKDERTIARRQNGTQGYVIDAEAEWAIKGLTALYKPRKPVRKKNPKRREAEFARCYHSEERVEFVKSLGCSVHGCTERRIENAHAVGGGMGRKADYDKVLPLCRDHHKELHKTGARTFEREHKLDLLAAAAVTDETWKESRR